MKTLKLSMPHFNIIWLLTAISPLFIFVLFLTRFSPEVQFQVLVMAALSYFAVAVLHHYQERTLTMEITIEYVLIAVLALLVLQGLVF